MLSLIEISNNYRINGKSNVILDIPQSPNLENEDAHIKPNHDGSMISKTKWQIKGESNCKNYLFLSEHPSVIKI